MVSLTTARSSVGRGAASGQADMTSACPSRRWRARSTRRDRIRTRPLARAIHSNATGRALYGGMRMRIITGAGLVPTRRSRDPNLASVIGGGNILRISTRRPRPRVWMTAERAKRRKAQASARTRKIAGGGPPMLMLVWAMRTSMEDPRRRRRNDPRQPTILCLAVDAVRRAYPVGSALHRTLKAPRMYTLGDDYTGNGLHSELHLSPAVMARIHWRINFND
ncbi:hypothetical protein RSAG8_00790, partial [Rhizoctonia solani AG-8 WAC10335]